MLKRIGLNRLWRLEPPEPPHRYCRRHPGELVHVDVKKLGCFDRPGLPAHLRRGGFAANLGAGWEYVHVAVDDTSRLAYVEVLDDEKGPTCVAFLRRAIGFFAAHGVVIERVMTDNGTGYRSKAHLAAVTALGIRHLRTRPYRPRTNGRRSGSSRRCSASGPMPSPAGRAGSGDKRSRRGSGTTTVDDHTAPWATAPPSAGSADERPWELHLADATRGAFPATRTPRIMRVGR